jgi:AcrR family transcriptional regulator
MGEKNETTEQRILEAAKQVFYAKGLAGARMEEIAEAAGINKAMLHYYFRTKDKLFEVIFSQALEQFIPKAIQILGSDTSLEEKVQAVVGFYFQMLSEHPYIPMFVLSSLHQNPDKFVDNLVSAEGFRPVELVTHLLLQVQQAIQRGEIRPIDPRNFVLHIISLSVFPFLARPMVVRLLGIPDPDYSRFLETRKSEVVEFILRGIRP